MKRSHELTGNTLTPVKLLSTWEYILHSLLIYAKKKKIFCYVNLGTQIGMQENETIKKSLTYISSHGSHSTEEKNEMSVGVICVY